MKLCPNCEWCDENNEITCNNCGYDYRKTKEADGQ